MTGPPGAPSLGLLKVQGSTFGPRVQSPRFYRLAGRVVVVLILVTMLGWATRRWMMSGGEREGEITATATRSALPITVTERGELESSKTVDGRCEVEGHQIKIVEILPEGTRVTKDQVVVRFDAEQLTRSYAEQEIKLKQAEGKAKAALTELEVQKNKSDSEIAKADLTLILAELEREKYLEGEYQVEVDDKKGAIALATRELDEAQEKLENFRKFVKKGFGTPEQLRLKEAEVARAQYNLNRDKAKLEVLEKYTRKGKETELKAKAEEARRELARAKSTSAAGVVKVQSELEASEVTAKLEKSQLERMKKQLEHTVVKAPQEGILVYSKDRYWDPSSRIQPGGVVHFQQTLFSLPDLTQMQVKVKIHESVVKKIKPGQQAEIRMDAYSDKLLHGTVEKVATLSDAQYWEERGVKEYVTIVKITDLPADAGLKPGMTAEVKILVNQLSNVLIVPVQSVAEIAGQHCCYVVTPSGIERRDITVGDNNDKFVAIKSGLDEGEPVTLDARARSTAEAKANERKPGEKIEDKGSKGEEQKPRIGG